MDDIREWISDNLRYILLGLALILVLAVAVVGIRAISNIASGKSPVADLQQTESETQAETTKDVIVETEPAAQTGVLQENDGKVLTAMTSYYSARTNGDTETLQKLDPSLTEQELEELTGGYVERYEDIRTYSRQGLADGEYVVYVCYNGKVQDIDTLVPSLTQYYLKSDDQGSLYIYDYAGDADTEAFLEETRKTTEVQDLIASVRQECDEAENSDPALKEFMSQYGSSQEGSTDETTADGESAADGSVMVAIDECNIRTEPNTECDVLGVLYIGETITKTGETEDGWTQVDYNGQTAYIKSEFLSVQQETESTETTDLSDDFAPGNAA
ncbi:SH3 domain-containing protein [Marvinbryantia formatexigens]|uniref:SH3 domain-containing protein n=1 Tax=Marvinbryantia formatexigens TaxID=168384 RepID=UPI00031C1EF4|nr:SH3 domain-containing protein [Marvinbryantia formatexigens]UWO24846.1 SH3 domain-containing protein [Marvinbryantia formatexigens DSM 14469]SDG79152.1 SH3 domain-containing protein [Marvinbryantia formatexigens]